MELVAIIATVILLATFITMIFSFAAYFVTRAKNIMKDRSSASSGNTTSQSEESASRVYFERYKPAVNSDAAVASGDTSPSDQWR